MNSWIVKDVICKECNSFIISCPSKNMDYYLYCSNKHCINHYDIEVYDDYDIDNMDHLFIKLENNIKNIL